MNTIKKLLYSALFTPLFLTSLSFCAQQGAPVSVNPPVQPPAQQNPAQLMLDNLQKGLKSDVIALNENLKLATTKRYASSTASIEMELEKVSQSFARISEFFSASHRFEGFLLQASNCITKKIEDARTEKNSEKQYLLLLQVQEMTDGLFATLDEKIKQPNKSGSSHINALIKKIKVPFWTDLLAEGNRNNSSWVKKITLRREFWTKQELSDFRTAIKTVKANRLGIVKDLVDNFKQTIKKSEHLSDLFPKYGNLIKVDYKYCIDECDRLLKEYAEDCIWGHAPQEKVWLCIPGGWDYAFFNNATRKADNERIGSIEWTLVDDSLRKLELLANQCEFSESLCSNPLFTKNELDFYTVLNKIIFTQEGTAHLVDGLIRKAIALRKSNAANSAIWGAQNVIDTAVLLGFKDTISDFVMGKAKVYTQNYNAGGMEVLARFFLNAVMAPDRCGLPEIWKQFNDMVDKLPPNVIKAAETADCDGTENERIWRLRAEAGALSESLKKTVDDKVKWLENLCRTLGDWSENHIKVLRDLVNTLPEDQIQQIGTALLYRDSAVVTTATAALSSLARTRVFGPAILSRINEPMAIILARLVDRGLSPDHLLALANRILDSALGDEFVNLMGSMAAEHPGAVKENVDDLLGLLGQVTTAGENLVKKGTRKIIEALISARSYITKGEWSTACWLCTTTEYNDLCKEIADIHMKIRLATPPPAATTQIPTSLPRCNRTIATEGFKNAMLQWNALKHHGRPLVNFPISQTLKNHFINTRAASFIVDKLKKEQLVKEQQIAFLLPLKDEVFNILQNHAIFCTQLATVRHKTQDLYTSWRWWDNLWLPSWINFWKKSSKLAEQESLIQNKMLALTRPMPLFEQQAKNYQHHYVTLLTQKNSINKMYTNWFSHLNLLEKQIPC